MHIRESGSNMGEEQIEILIFNFYPQKYIFERDIFRGKILFYKI